MFGTKIGKLLKNSGKKERIQFWFASMVTVTATLLYTMFAFGLSDITNDSLSKNDVQQLQGVLSSVILISIIAVMFFQWILATQLQNLFNIRKHFTEALLLMGTPHKKIVKIYVSELVQVHVSATLIGCVIGSSIYIVVANVLQIEERYVPVQIYLICVLIGILLNSYTIGSNLYKLFRGNIVEKIRNGNDYIKTNKINVKGVLVRICIAAIYKRNLLIMEKLKIVIILLGLIWFSGCGYIKQTNIESKDIAFSEEETTSIQSDYENYIGTWSEEGKSHESIIYEGGTEFSVEITSDNELNGYLYSQQEISGRFAEIDIICRIENGECYYPFSDDGWGNSGILYIQFETNVIKISVQDFVMGESNTSGFGIDRTYILSKEEANQNSTEYDGEQKEQLLQYSVDWSEDQILDEIEKRAVYLNRCSYYEEVLDFLENDREVRDISMYINPLYYTDTEYYNEDSFSGVPSLIIHLAKNEIYARHGYIFKDENLKNYFMGQLWYIPSVKAEEFDDSVFSDIEKRNLELLNRLDTYKK